MTTRMTIGELAARSGLTVRTLHHYDQLGLLSPSHRSDGGYRLYSAGDAERLLQIVALKQLGLSLPEIRAKLLDSASDVKATLYAHLQQMEQKLAQQELALSRLRRLVHDLPAHGASLDHITSLLESYSMYEKYFSAEQRELLQQRGQQLGDEVREKTQLRWPQLIAEMQSLKAAGKTSSDAEVLVLAREWMQLVRLFTGGDQQMAQSVAVMYSNEPSMRERSGLDMELLRFVGAAIKILRQQDGEI